MEMSNIIILMIKEMNLMSDRKGGGSREWGYASYDVDRYDN